MSLELHFHPLSSFCQKVLIALYENETPFTPRFLDLGNAEARAAFERLWPVAKMPVLCDLTKDRTIPESTIIIEYLAHHAPGKIDLVPKDPEIAWQARLWDRFHDLHVNEVMQRIVGDRLRPADERDPRAVERAKGMLATAYGILEREMRTKTWAVGDAFTMADCAAAPALFYANEVLPFGQAHPNTAAYLRRLMDRPSYARSLTEAKPYFAMFPRE